MKFHSAEDRYMFLLEVGKNPLQDNDTSDDHNLFIHKRKKSVSLLKDFTKSNNAKRAWGRSKNKFLFAMDSFHRSIEGRKFHRQLTRFLTTKNDTDRKSSLQESQLEPFKAWLAEELTYYHDLPTQAFLEWIFDEIS